jgi:hypothetical protein
MEKTPHQLGLTTFGRETAVLLRGGRGGQKPGSL